MNDMIMKYVSFLVARYLFVAFWIEHEDKTFKHPASSNFTVEDELQQVARWGSQSHKRGQSYPGGLIS